MHRKSSVLCSSLAALLFAFSAQGLDVIPESGVQGTEIQVDGIVPSTDDPAVVVFAPTGVGVVVGDIQPIGSSLVGTVGPAPAAFVGQVETWWGQRFALPPRLIQGQGRTYSTQSPSWFAGSRTEPTTGMFSVDQPSAQTIGSAWSAQRIRIDLDPVTWDNGDFTRVRVDIVIDGGNGGGTKPPDETFALKSGNLPAQSLPTFNTATMLIDVIPTIWTGAPPTLTAAQLASDLASVLNATFGPLGLVVTSQGSRLKISTAQGNVIRGFANIQLCSTGCL